MFLKARNHPGLAQALIDFLEMAGPTPEDELQALFVPEALPRNPTEAASEWAGTISFKDTSSTLVEAGVLEADSTGRLGVAKAYLEARKSTPERALTFWLLHEARTGSDPFLKEEGPTADLARLLTWFLDIDPTGPWPSVGARADANPVDRLLQDTDRVLQQTPFPDVTSWTRFTRWASALGLGELRPNGALDPDPTEAIGAALPSVLDGDLPISEFLGRLSERLPLFGGHLERAWRRLDGLGPSGHVKPSLANALLRLEGQGRLTLDSGLDARDVVLFEFSRFEPFRGVEGQLAPEKQRYARIRPGGRS